MSTMPPMPGTITKAKFAQLLRLYPEVQEAAYKSKIKDPKKLAAAQQGHDWRYNELPKLVAERKSESSSPYLEKDELVRLTQWKIVHGQHRPFLPGMVKKNEQERVGEVTSSAFDLQAGASYGAMGIPESLDKALREAALLHGIGPATATLICSIYDPINVCFFEDELAAWLCPDLPKLKYTWAEYKTLFTEIEKLRKRFGTDHKASDVEKVAFVVGHLHELDEEQLEAVNFVEKMDYEAEQETNTKPTKAAIPNDLSVQDKESSESSKPNALKPKRKGEAEEEVSSKSEDAKPKVKRRKK